MKHPILLLIALLLAPRAALHAVEAPKPAGKPNILLIVTDDMGYDDATCYWNTDLQTPVIDGIARRGIRFTQFRRSGPAVVNERPRSAPSTEAEVRKETKREKHSATAQTYPSLLSC